jgi:hypothetical protein
MYEYGDDAFEIVTVGRCYKIRRQGVKRLGYIRLDIDTLYYTIGSKGYRTILRWNETRKVAKLTGLDRKSEI